MCALAESWAVLVSSYRAVTGAGVALSPRCCPQHISPVSTLAPSPSCETLHYLCSFPESLTGTASARTSTHC